MGLDLCMVTVLHVIVLHVMSCLCNCVAGPTAGMAGINPPPPMVRPAGPAGPIQPKLMPTSEPPKLMPTEPKYPPPEPSGPVTGLNSCHVMFFHV